MYGGILGLLIGAGFSLFGEASWWWEFAWFFGGMFMEFMVRMGAGEEFFDAVGNCITAGIELSASGDGGGGGWDFGGGDCGGGDGGGGGGD